MKIVKFCLAPILVFLLALFVLGMFAPDGWDVEVSTEIAATPEQIHPYVNRLKTWEDWVAFSREKDVQFEFSYEGPEEGVGAIAHSRGPGSNVRWEITASDPAKGVWFDEELEGSYLAKGAIMYAVGDGMTRVTWVDKGTLGSSPFIKLFHYLVQNSLTDGFGRNLANLKEIVEGK